MNNIKTKQLTKMAVLAALAIVLVTLIHFPLIPAVSFLEYDPADVPIFLGTFAMGPWAGFAITVVVAAIQGVTVSSASSWYGIVMHILATGTFTLVAGYVYKKEKTKKRAVLALALGSIAWILVMIPANLFLTPIYLQMFGMSAEIATATVKSMLGWIILFNFAKTGINSFVTFVLYKRVSGLLHK